MLDIKMIGDNKEEVEKGLLKRIGASDFDLDVLLNMYEEYLDVRKEYDVKRAEQNKYNDKVKGLKKDSAQFKSIMSELKKLSSETKKLETRSSSLRRSYEGILQSLPNVPEDDVPAGGKEKNEVIREGGKKTEMDFKLKNHLTLGEKLGIFDFDRAAKMSGAHMPMYKGDGVKMVWAMITYFMQKHDHDGFTGIIPPHLLNEESAFVAGQLPKFYEDVYWTQDDQCLIPTAETALVNLHRDELFKDGELPKRYYAYTPCYRREAGAYGSRDRGMMRVHQFHKVEMFMYAEEGDSDKALEELTERAESLVQDLGLKYRVVKLAAEDLTFSMAKTIDIEIWLPFDKTWTEVSSISNARDFQSVRGNMRYRTKDGKLKHVHTLNASGLATPRLMVGILEAYQKEDGSVEVPKVLREYVGKDLLTVT